MTDKKTEAGPLPDIETLAIVADWKHDLRARYKRAELRYELIGGNGPEIEALSAEMEDFKRLCRVLKGVIGNA